MTQTFVKYYINFETNMQVIFSIASTKLTLQTGYEKIAPRSLQTSDKKIRVSVVKS
jgi:hypothetical protein